jgi:hypothetical protein
MTKTTAEYAQPKALPTYMVSITGSADVRMFHPVIMQAIANGGEFGEDFADIFKLTKTPDGSRVDYILTFV